MDSNYEVSGQTSSRMLFMEYSLVNVKSSVIENSDLTSQMITTAVKVAIQEIKLLSQGKEAEAAARNFSLKDFSVEDKCTKPLFALHNYPTYLLGGNEMDYTKYKFAMDRRFVDKMLSMLRQELSRNGTYKTFTRLLKETVHSKQAENEYLHQSEYKKKMKGVLAYTGFKEIRGIQQELDTLKDDAVTVQNAYEELRYELLLKERYVNKWELSRNRQHHLKSEQKIEHLNRKIADWKSKYERENRVNEEVERYTFMVHEDIQKELLEWRIKYDKELEEKVCKIQELKAMREEQSEQLIITKQLYERQMVALEEGRQRRAQWLREAAFLEKQTMAALKIQSWWRGVMVRRGLGRYKKKKKRHAKKDGKGKKDAKGKKNASAKKK